jgi:hypothetical protein
VQGEHIRSQSSCGCTSHLVSPQFGHSAHIVSPVLIGMVTIVSISRGVNSPNESTYTPSNEDCNTFQQNKFTRPAKSASYDAKKIRNMPQAST